MPTGQTGCVPYSLTAGPEIVAIPGPTIVPDRVLSAMHRPMPDLYAGELLTVTDEIYERLPALARTTSPALITISNGHGAWAMALSNTLSRGDRVLVLECGVFARVWGEMAEFDGLQVETMIAEDGAAIAPEAVLARLHEDTEREIKAVLMVQTDTASSARNDVAAVRRALDAADHPALLMVDCIASMGCEQFEMDAWGVDVALAASQKGLMTPPGLGFVWAGPRALVAHRTAGLRTRYWDWTFRLQDGPQYLRFCGTAPVSHIFGFREALRMIEEEGLEARWQRHYALASAVRAAVDAWSVPAGLSLLVRDPAHRGDSVTTITTGDIDSVRLSDLARDGGGVTLGVGLQHLAGRAFRIGHMGHVSAASILGVLGVVEAALLAMDAPIGGSGVAAASASIAQSM
jgi:alanine-glyoxylate transaminase/serine-glyoxylate transaminase/serine-pyruvate transaminase